MADTTKSIKFVILKENTFTGVTSISASDISSKLSAEGITGTSELPIVYIEDTHQIFVHDNFYGINDAELSQITETLNAAGNLAIQNATSINTINLRLGATGATADANGSIQAQINQLVADIAAATGAISNNTSSISGVSAAVQALTVNGEAFGTTGAVVIDANEIKIGTTSTGITSISSTSTVTDALSKLNEKINAIGDAAGSATSVEEIRSIANQALGEATAAHHEALLHPSVTGAAGITVNVTAKTTATGAIYEVGVDSSTIPTKSEVTGAVQGGITTAVNQVVGSSTDNSTAMTIYGARAYASELVNGAYTAIANLGSEHLAIIEQIKAELNDPNGASGIVSTFLDKLVTVGAGFNGIDGATTGTDQTIKNYIDTNISGLSGTIANLDSNSVKSVNGITGTSVTLGATNILISSYTAATGAVTTSDSVSNAIAKVENKANSGLTAAAAAQTTADTALGAATAAQSTADEANAKGTTALGLLKWVII